MAEIDEPEIYGGGCECWVTPEHMHFVHYGATEPGSAIEYNPDCPKHGDRTAPIPPAVPDWLEAAIEAVVMARCEYRNIEQARHFLVKFPTDRAGIERDLAAALPLVLGAAADAVEATPVTKLYMSHRVDTRMEDAAIVRNFGSEVGRA